MLSFTFSGNWLQRSLQKFFKCYLMFSKVVMRVQYDIVTDLCIQFQQTYHVQLCFDFVNICNRKIPLCTICNGMGIDEEKISKSPKIWIRRIQFTFCEFHWIPNLFPNDFCALLIIMTIATNAPITTTTTMMRKKIVYFWALSQSNIFHIVRVLHLVWIPFTHSYHSKTLIEYVKGTWVLCECH